jgi:hypothetical protein
MFFVKIVQGSPKHVEGSALEFGYQMHTPKSGGDERRRDVAEE